MTTDYSVVHIHIAVQPASDRGVHAMGFVLIFFGLSFGFYAAEERNVYYLIMAMTVIVIGGALEIGEMIIDHLKSSRSSQQRAEQRNS